MAEIEGFILAGGASSRMGVDKAHLRLGGQTLVGRAAEALRAVCGRVSVVSSKPDAHQFGLPVVRDLFEGRGALGGLHAALAHASAGWVAVLSCDLPFVSGALFERLKALRPPDSDAVAPLQPDGRPQPLCALYSRAASLPLADELIRAHELRPRVLLSRLRTRWISHEELDDLGGSQHFFRNLNTPEDFAEAEKSFESRV
jgi:molybdopterin-guanine dinucleotide biosynthesis protein A